VIPGIAQRLGRKSSSKGYPEDWRRRLVELLSAAPRHRIAIIGVGHSFRGDDYVGSYIARKLAKLRHRDGVLILDAEDSPEAFLPKLSGLKLRHVLFIDACETGTAPGEVRLFQLDETSYPFFTTHGLPLKVLAREFLPDSKPWVLAIQPASTEFGAGLTAEVRSAADSISEYIEGIFGKEARFL